VIVMASEKTAKYNTNTINPHPITTPRITTYGATLAHGM